MTTEHSLLDLIRNASLIVQIVMALLLLVSLASWNLIFLKGRAVAKARHAVQLFEQRFWSGGDLNTLYKEINSRKEPPLGLEAIFEAGLKEFTQLRRQPGMSPPLVLEGAQRAMRAALNREADELETHLPFLATVGSTSPYVGLFGTVWGIMNSFRALGSVQQATLAMVAPGIAEALIATAVGLFAAIPAVIAFNRYNTAVERLINRYDTFVDEFSTVLQRHVHRPETGM